MEMQIICPKILLIKGDVAVSSIARFFEPMDEIAEAFLKEAPPYETSVIIADDEEIAPTRKIFGVCIAPKGQTFQGVLDQEVMKGWSYETLGGWYTRHTRFPFPVGYRVFTPGTIYLDENYTEWIPSVEVVSVEGAIGKLFMKEVPSREFKTERLILVSRIVEK